MNTTAAVLADDRATMQTKLTELAGQNDEIAAGWEIKGDQVNIEQTSLDAFRDNLAQQEQLRTALTALDGQIGVKSWSEQAGDPSVAVAAAAGLGAQLMEPLDNRTLGERFTDSDEFKSLLTSGSAHMSRPWEIDGPDLGSQSLETKDVYTQMPGLSRTRVGWGRTQVDPIVDRQRRTQRVRDLFPVARTNANLIEYFRVTGFTNNAATVPERNPATAGPPATPEVFGIKPQSTLAFAVAQAPVRTIAHWEAAHRNVLADEPQLQSTINNELLYGLRLAEDAQILNGDGTGENLLGIFNTSGIQGYSQVAGDNKADAIRRSITKVILAYYETTGIVLHPNDWEDIELAKDANGQYVVAVSVSAGAEQRLWRTPVVDTPAIAEGSWLTGAFGLGAQLYDREQGNLRIAEQHADFFIRNAVAILAEQRIALAVKRPESFVHGTFLP